MADPRHRLGLDCEDATAAWLTSVGWRVVARRKRSAEGGEVDIVAIDPRGVLVAVEVKARRTARAGSGIESIDARRVMRLRRTLAAFARASTKPRLGLRIDLVAAEAVPGRPGHWQLRRFPGIG